MLCKNMAELEKALKAKINNALSNEVMGAVMEVVYDNTLKVYDRPHKRYSRRGEYGGLGDPSNLVGRMENGKLVIENITKTNPYLNGYDDSLTFDYNSFTQRGLSEHLGNEYLAPIIESNNGYDYYTPDIYVPFMHNSYEDLILFGQHIKAFKQGLKRQGLEVK